MTDEKRDPKHPDEPTRQEQKDQQRDPALQSYTGGGGGDKAADPDQNLIIEDDPRFARRPDDPTPRRRPDAL